MSHKHLPLILFLVFIVIHGNSVTAQSDNSNKPIDIKANSAEINDATGISVYRGDVEITQGSRLLTGEKVVIEIVDQKIQKITAEGNPSTYRQTADDGKTTYAEAGKIVHSFDVNKIVLTNNAKLTEDDSTLSGDRIVLYTDKETISAGSTNENNRVHISIPQKKNK